MIKKFKGNNKRKKSNDNNTKIYKSMNRYLINGNRIKYLFIFEISFFLTMIDVMIWKMKNEKKEEKRREKNVKWK